MKFTYLSVKVVNVYGKHPFEDSLAYEPNKNCLAWADGITRIVDRDGEYPNPSPSALAATAFTNAALSALLKEKSPVEGCQKGNQAITEIGSAYEKEWGGFNFGVHDYPGCVGGVAHLKPPRLDYCVLSDCGLVVIHNTGKIAFQTEDRLQTARTHPDWPAITGPNDIQGRKKRQRDWRNRPSAKHPTYGAFTGEDFALINSDENGQKKYLITGSYHLRPEETAISYTDGIIPFLADQQFLLLASEATEREIVSYLAENPLDAADDDRSCVIIRVN